MKKTLDHYGIDRLIILLVGVMLSTSATAQDEEWKNHLKNGVHLKSNIVKRQDANCGMYKAVKTSDVPADKIKSCLLNFNNHEKILDSAEKSVVIATLSDKKWKVYHQFDAPWPAPNYHTIQIFELEENEQGFKLTGHSINETYEDEKHKAMPLFNITYDITALENGGSEIRLEAEFIPVGSLPKWMLNKWFPDGPVGMIERLEKEANK